MLELFKVTDGLTLTGAYISLLGKP